jgi:hypothetical protein
MGLFKKVSEARMKDGVDGTLKVVGITMPSSEATDCNYRMDAVVSADGLAPTAIVHHGYCSVSKWPYVGQELAVKVDRAKPDHVVIDFGKVAKSKDVARNAAEQLAEQMRTGGSPTTSVPGVTVDGGSVTVAPDGSYQISGFGGGSININLDQLTATSGGQTQAAPDPEAATTFVSSADVIARGTAGSATLLGTFPTDEPAVKPDHTNVGLMLNVMIDGHPPYQVQNLYAVPQDKLAALTPGALLPVKVDLASAEQVAVDWSLVA